MEENENALHYHFGHLEKKTRSPLASQVIRPLRKVVDCYLTTPPCCFCAKVKGHMFYQCHAPCFSLDTGIPLAPETSTLTSFENFISTSHH